MPDARAPIEKLIDEAVKCTCCQATLAQGCLCIGRVVESQVRGRISVQLPEGGVFHLEPERVAVLLKKAGSAHGV